MKSNVPNNQESSTGSIWGYIAGFGLSLMLTGVSFYLVHRHIDSRHISPSDDFMLIALMMLAVIQLFVQLIFFLHLDSESKPRWNASVLAFAATVVLILVLGSIWIMNSLDYNHPRNIKTHDGQELNTPQQTDDYIIEDEGIDK